MAVPHLEAATLAFRERAVPRGIDLVVARGEIVGVMGPNGGDRPTLLRLAAGLLQPATGHARLSRGRARRRIERLARVLGFAPSLDLAAEPCSTGTR